MSFASATVFHHEYASTHAATLCAQVPYLCFVLLLYIPLFVTGGSCSWLHVVHSRRWDGMEGGGPGMLFITPQCFHVSCCFTIDSKTLCNIAPTVQFWEIEFLCEFHCWPHRPTLKLFACFRGSRRPGMPGSYPQDYALLCAYSASVLCRFLQIFAVQCRIVECGLQNSQDLKASGKGLDSPPPPRGIEVYGDVSQLGKRPTKAGTPVICFGPAAFRQC